MPFISQASIQEVTDRLDAVAVVGEYAHVEKKGGRFWACCPFHQEKTASFTVNPDLKTFYCFGCKKHGTIIDFLMEMDKLSFPEAIETLAKKFGVDLVYEKSGGGSYSADDEAKKKEKDELFELYHRMSGTFHHFLLKKPEAEPGKLYIISRGINIEMIEQFRLGYAPADRFWLYKFLSQKGYSGKFLAASGLFSTRHPEVSLFSGRLIFPIADRQGRVVAFGGRFLDLPQAADQPRDGWTPPKYINSPELGIYKKGETLYGLDLALPEIRRTKTAYIAEGYLDVIALHQAGITNALAPLGTAFTGEQAKLLKRWAEKVILFFDSDRAGQEAALKGIVTCRKNGLSCAVVTPETENGLAAGKAPAEHASKLTSKDPADILKLFGPEALQKRAEWYINDFEYLIKKAETLYDTAASGSIQGKARAIAFLFPYMELLDSEVSRDSCIEAAADALGLNPAVVAEDYRRFASGKKPEAGKPEERGVEINDELSMLLAVALDFVSPQKEKLFSKFRDELDINEIEDPNAKEMYVALEECLRYGESGMAELLSRISSGELKKFIVERSATGEFSVNQEQLVSDGIKKIGIKRLELRQEGIIVKLRQLKKSPSEKEEGEAGLAVRELLAEKMRIDGELHKLKQGRQA